MTTNVYFSKGTPNEQHLYEDLAIEAIQIYGHDVFYIPRTLVNKDELFGEDALSRFDDAYGIEMWMETQEGYEGEKELVSRFGLEIRDETTFVVSRRRWDNTVSSDANLIVNTRPDEGDLIYMPTVQKLFEISFVDHDDPFYQVHNLPTYKLKCKTFEYSSEVIDTGLAVLDSIETANSLDTMQHQITLEQNTVFNQGIRLEGAGEGRIFDSSSIGYDQPGAGSFDASTLTFDNAGPFIITEDETLGGALAVENSVEGADASYIVLETYDIATIDENSQNEDFELADDNILDFTESNPFGDAGMK